VNALDFGTAKRRRISLGNRRAEKYAPSWNVLSLLEFKCLCPIGGIIGDRSCLDNGTNLSGVYMDKKGLINLYRWDNLGQTVKRSAFL